MQLVLEKAEQGLRIVSLTDTAAGQELLAGNALPLFSITVRDTKTKELRLKEYFYTGRMARPPKLMGQVPTVTADWQWHGEWPITADAIMTGAWQLQDQSKMVLLFANVSDGPFAGHFEFDPSEDDLSGTSLAVTPITPEGAKDQFKIQATDRPEVELAARSVLACEITPIKGK